MLLLRQLAVNNDITLRTPPCQKSARMHGRLAPDSMQMHALRAVMERTDNSSLTFNNLLLHISLLSMLIFVAL